MIQKQIPRIAAIVLIIIIVLGAFNAIAASNTVPTSRAYEDSFGISPNDLKPSDCTMNISNITTGSGLIFGTAANDLIMGSTSGDIIFGAGGNDCIAGGAGNDWILGGAGTDVCIGGPGSNTFNTCETEIDP
jgi:Ca2+-binding RTX toxin-like protein